MKKVLVVGAAISGQAAAKFLVKNGYDVYLTDAKVLANREQLMELGMKVYDGGHPDLLKEIDFEFVVKNPGIRYTMPLIAHFVNKKTPIYNEIEVGLSHQKQHSYVAITGTNGKTTTTTMVGELLKTLNPENKAVGNIGLPVCDAIIDAADKKLELAVEIGAFQLLGVETFHPHVSTITNLSEDHIDFFGSLEKYYLAKTLVYKNQNENDFFLRNNDDPEIMRICTDIPCQVVDFSLYRDDTPVRIENNWIVYNDVKLVDLSKFKLVGMHNVQNAMIASTIGYLMGVPVETIQEVFANFRGVAHRIEYVREVNGVRYYNDSKGTNVDSTIVALKAFPNNPVHLLVGGYDKKVGFEGLLPYCGNVKCMYAFGATKQMFADIFENTLLFETMDEALEEAKNNAVENDVVLLSPVCASWDQYPNFEVRGDKFKEIVNNF